MDLVDVHGASILIVDDQKDNSELLKKMLIQEGFKHIETVTDPEKVFDLHREHNFDLILLDIELSEMNGFQLLERLRTNIEDPYLSLIVVTTHPEHKLRALQAGAKDFISKPFDLVEVVTRMRNILEVRMLYKQLETHVRELEQHIDQRTEELRESEARFRTFTDLASDWYWEQDNNGNFTKVSGPVPEILGIKIRSAVNATNSILGTGWNLEEQAVLREKIAARESFLDFKYTRLRPDGQQQIFLVSGQPMFSRTCIFLGYRGVGVDISAVSEN